MEQLSVHNNTSSNQVCIKYEPKTEKAIFDICDLHGRIVASGSIDETETKICVKDLDMGQYIICIVDGGEMVRSSFKVSATE